MRGESESSGRHSAVCEGEGGKRGGSWGNRNSRGRKNLAAGCEEGEAEADVFKGAK